MPLVSFTNITSAPITLDSTARHGDGLLQPGNLRAFFRINAEGLAALKRLGLPLVEHNEAYSGFTVDSAPGIAHDITQSFNVGDYAFVRSTKQFYQCTSNAVGAATWVSAGSL